MAHSVKALSRFATSDMGRTNQTDTYVYSTNDTLAELVAAGYFNDSRKTLKAGDVIMAVADKDGTASHVVLLVTASPATGNVTVSAQGAVLGQDTIADIALAAVTGVDGSGSNAASKADVDARFATVQTAINAILANLEAAGVNASA
ncbi:MAG: hypothetical protein CMN87_18215 [Stappia sp.]|uniref:hypothetical protein n=1 Tax=Stappia sp. TaxID=1870903 RepID=UPI000C63BE45|nr:hypothetical protein [Stappia sp.]MAA97408.1 hypothetical protein [Stappia sp.]MBM21941.1 hypothetical protein [Stappia sp.]|tara:strand:+ start:263 stop:703 length:441 start_codon:yes stop_codon:yes gene_type:complete